ncbi:hypothetical protein CDD83_7467 [Cordyceps sp. RAO-2017]|nr:hypothetical protein CDD83_7467 [Cordyceps sp. RAO-2017]
MDSPRLVNRPPTARSPDSAVRDFSVERGPGRGAPTSRPPAVGVSQYRGRPMEVPKGSTQAVSLEAAQAPTLLPATGQVPGRLVCRPTGSFKAQRPASPTSAG